MRKIAIKVGSNTFYAVNKAKSMVVFIGETYIALCKALMNPKKIRWRDTLFYMNNCGFEALPIILLICFLVGLILGINSAIILAQWGTEVFMADMIGLVIIKELGPLMVAIIATGRSGSAFAAEIGTMKVNEEVNALTTMGLEPSRFLVIPKLIAMLIVMPLLAAFGNLAGIIGGFSVGFFQLDIPAVTYYQRTINAVTVMDFSEGMIKATCFAVLLTVIGCMSGFDAKDDAQGVGKSTTSAVVNGIFIIIVCDAILTLLFNIL